MVTLRDLKSRLLAGLKRLCKHTSKNEKTEKSEVTCAEKVAQVQQAIRNGEEVQRVSELRVGKPTLRKTLHDMPAAQPHTTFAKERAWFDKTQHDTRYGASPASTFNRLEAFLSTTDPKQLAALDPTWNRGLPEAPDDRPQPKKSSVDFPRVRTAKTDDLPVDPVFEEGNLSNSISGVF